jgi:hypothetical protein
MQLALFYCLLHLGSMQATISGVLVEIEVIL